MHTLTKKQITWLTKAARKRENGLGFVYFHAQRVNGQIYVAVTDGHVLHAIPILNPNVESGKCYMLEDNVLKETDDVAVKWDTVVPKHYSEEKSFKRKTLRYLKQKSLNRGDLLGFVLDTTTTKIVLDPVYLYNATSYSATCTQKTGNRWYKPVLFEYTDGSFAIVMPMKPDYFFNLS